MQIERIKKISKESSSRLDLCAALLNEKSVKNFAEIGVFRGVFAEKMLSSCPSIEQYIMVDPWRHLDEWNKPANRADDVFNEFYEETMSRTDFAKDKRVVLREMTQTARDKIDDNSLDCAYIDGDHTLRGITVDMVAMYDKLRDGGLLIGDDFCPTIWQHGLKYEPTCVFPFAVYFAESRGDHIYALPYRQFCIIKNEKVNDFKFHDLTGKYGDRSLLKHANFSNMIYTLGKHAAPSGLKEAVKKVLGK